MSRQIGFNNETVDPFTEVKRSLSKEVLLIDIHMWLKMEAFFIARKDDISKFQGFMTQGLANKSAELL